MVTFESTAITFSSDVFKTGLISNKDASISSYALYKAETNLTISLKAFPFKPKLNAILRH